MKRSFLILLILVFALYAKLGYEWITVRPATSCQPDGVLSDIADEVVAIPLQPAGKEHLDRVNSVRKEGKDLFLISHETLYRFTTKGEFICRITDPKVIHVAGYVVNAHTHQLIVLGNVNDIHYYSYEGELLNQKKLKSDLPEHRLSSVTLHRNHIWTTEEHLATDSASQLPTLHKQVVQYDSSFQKLASHRVVNAHLGREDSSLSPCPSLLGISQGSGAMYAYTPPTTPKLLLRDTLFIRGQQQRGTNNQPTGTVTNYPVCMGSRFWVASYDNKQPTNQPYTFCYDTLKNRAWQVEGGLVDNFYGTGAVPKLEAMDAYCQSYSYCKSGKALNESLSEWGKSEGLVLFIVRLKG